MKILALVLTVVLAGCNLAIAQSPYATRLPAELQTAQMDSLADVTWLQGTTPAIRVEPLLRGRPVAVDADTTVRMVIGPSATGTLYAARTNLAAVTNAYEIQWPTIGTNSAGAAWFYTLLFDRDGYTYWSGSGKLYIEETTSTASNGLEWIEYTIPNVGWANVVGDPADNAALVQYVDDHVTSMAETAEPLWTAASNRVLYVGDVAAVAYGTATNEAYRGDWGAAASNLAAGAAGWAQTNYLPLAGGKMTPGAKINMSGGDITNASEIHVEHIYEKSDPYNIAIDIQLKELVGDWHIDKSLTYLSAATNSFLRPDGGTNTISFDGSGSMIVAVDGTAAMTISTNGKVGIGTGIINDAAVSNLTLGGVTRTDWPQGTILGATINGPHTVATNDGILEFTVASGGTGWTNLSITGTGNAITGATASADTLTLQRGEIEGGTGGTSTNEVRAIRDEAFRPYTTLSLSGGTALVTRTSGQWVMIEADDGEVTLDVDVAAYTNSLAIRHQICWVRGTNETYSIVTNNIDNTTYVDLPISTTNHLFLERRPGWPRFQIWQDFR